jgi:tungstate transport system substrate-binding protein
LALVLVNWNEAQAADDAATPVVVRCAVIGGMYDTGLWQAVSQRFEQHRPGCKLQMVAVGPKHVIAESFREGEADLITMHSSDAIINLVADGFGVDPQPWVRNDFVLVGPTEDPAGVKGGRNAVRALTKILDSPSKLLLHGGQGANEVLNDLLVAGDLELDPDQVLSLPAERHQQMLEHAAKEKAYALVARIPFLKAHTPESGLEILVQGDRRLRRPYLIVTRTPTGPSDQRAMGAAELTRFLRTSAMQDFIAQFGQGAQDHRPLFFPVAVPNR